MHTPIRTEMGTVLVNGIEYNECPLPGQLVKLMKRKWADQLLKKGAVRFHDLEYYRQWENKYLGDPNDGIAVLNVNNLSLETRSGNDVYAWCLSLPEIKHERMLLLAQHGGYDCKVVISNPKEFFTRVSNWLSKHKKGFQLHCGLVTYNRCVNVAKATANATQRGDFPSARVKRATYAETRRWCPTDSPGRFAVVPASIERNAAWASPD